MTTIVISSLKFIYVAAGLYPTSEECGFYAHIDKYSENSQLLREIDGRLT